MQEEADAKAAVQEAASLKELEGNKRQLRENGGLGRWTEAYQKRNNGQLREQ